MAPNGILKWLQHQLRAIRKGKEFPTPEARQGVSPPKWPMCFWILHPAGQLHLYLCVSRLYGMDYCSCTVLWTRSSLTMLPTPCPSTPPGGTIPGPGGLIAEVLSWSAATHAATQASAKATMWGWELCLPDTKDHCLLQHHKQSVVP